MPPTLLTHGTLHSLHVWLQAWLAAVDMIAGLNAADAAETPVVAELHVGHPYRVACFPGRARLGACSVMMDGELTQLVNEPLSGVTLEHLVIFRWRLVPDLRFVARLIFFVPLAIYDYFHPYPKNSSAGTTTALRPTAIAAFCLSPLSLLFLWQLRRRRQPRHHIYLTRPWCGTARSS